jgi:hypothetical protein
MKQFSIDNPEFRYWLGFLVCDGTFYEKNIKLDLKYEDKGHLEKFTKFLGIPIDRVKTYTSLTTYGVSTMCRVNIGGAFLREVYSVGLSPGKKTGKEVVPHDLKLDKDFWLGVIDGDGSFYLSEYRNVIRSLDLSSSYDLCYSFRDFGMKLVDKPHCKVEVRRHPKTEKLYRVRFGGRMARDILDSLYKDTNVFLDRKYDKFLGINREYKVGVRINNRLTEEQWLEVIDLIQNNGWTQKQAALSYGVGESTVSVRLSKMKNTFLCVPSEQELA